MGKKFLSILACMLMTASMALAQKQITGSVVDSESGEPLIGVAVRVPNTQTGVLTDAEGKFSISLPSGQKNLTFSFMGMKPATIVARDGMKVLLETETKAMDEVIVVAFGQQKKSAFTGSATVVNSEDLAKHTVTNVQDALVGAVPGLQMRGGTGEPGSNNAHINIRGLNSLYADTDPLVIVDGAPYPESLSALNPDDVESISVLKDAASAALYGARGAGGVIIITTKKGKSREAQITADVKWGANTRAVQDYDVITDPAQFYETYYAQLYNYRHYGLGYGAEASNAWANTSMLNHLGYNVYTVPVGEQLIGMNGKLNPNATLGRSYLFDPTDPKSETYYMIPDDWRNSAYHTALRQEYTVNANAANDRGSYYFSVGHLNEDGIVEYSSYRRTTARLKADYLLKSWLKVGVNASYTHSDTESNPNLSSSEYGSTNLFYYTSRIAPIYPIYVRVIDPVTGQPVIRTDEFGNQQYDYGIASTNYGVGRAFLQTGNPFGSNRYNKVNKVGNMVNASATADVYITKDLKFNNTSTILFNQSSFSDYENPFYGPKVVVNGEITKEQTNSLRQNHVQTLNYSHNWNGHDLSAMIGHEWYDVKNRYLNAARTGGFSPDIPELNAFATMSGSKSYTSEYNVEGYFMNVLYNYNEKYFGSASYRRDATSRFDKEHRWGNFWSFGGAWLINKEDFFKADWVDELKFKASVGQQGNDATGDFRYVDTYTLSKANDTSMAPTFRQLGNPEISWETMTNVNVGLEFNLWKGRLMGSLDYYYRKTADQLFWLSVPESAGVRGYYGNAGDIRNSGLELTLTGSIIRNKDLDWSVTANISHNSSKILSLPEAKITENGGYYESPFWYEVGGPVNNYMTYAYAGVNEQGKALYYYDKNLSTLGGQKTNIINKPGTEKSGTTTNIGEASRYTCGSTLPKAYGGFSTTLRWKGLDATVSFDYQLGGKIYDSQYAGLMAPATSDANAGQTYHVDVLNAWTPNNTSSNIPRWQYGDAYAAYGSDRFLASASYLNFQNFTVGYSLPTSWISRLQLSKVRIYCTGENLCFWSARKGLDPRQSFENVTSISSYSPIRTISGGIQLTF